MVAKRSSGKVFAEDSSPDSTEHFKKRLRSFKYAATAASKPSANSASPTRTIAQRSSDKKVPNSRQTSKATERNGEQSRKDASRDPKDRRVAPPLSSNARSTTGSNRSKYYKHLPYLNDVLAPKLTILFIGLNPGITTAQQGHAYAHPSNRFWKLLHSSGCTDTLRPPSDDVNMPELYNFGFTNIVSRPSKEQAELTRAEMVEGAPVLDDKAREWRPESVCLVGKGIWEAVWQWRTGKKLKKDEFRYGWQDEQWNLGKTQDWAGSWVFVAASTSGASASLRPAEKEEIWRPLGEWAKEKRRQRRNEQDCDTGKQQNDEEKTSQVSTHATSQ